jgi:hypothetical protein
MDSSGELLEMIRSYLHRLLIKVSSLVFGRERPISLRFVLTSLSSQDLKLSYKSHQKKIFA